MTVFSTQDKNKAMPQKKLLVIGLFSLTVALSGCATDGNYYRSDVYSTRQVNQAQRVNTVEIIAINPAQVAVNNSENSDRARATGAILGAIAGAAAPLVSFLLSGMPMLAMLPLMMVELCAYGLVAGLLRGIKLPSLAKVVIAQLAGRVVLTAAAASGVFACGSSKAIAATWTSDLAAGLPGLALQWALIPLAAYWTESLIAKRNH